MSDKIQIAFDKLKHYCESESFKGYDPFDGLNSKLFRSVPYLAGNRIARLAWIQIFKRSPINFRKLTGVDKGYNPKALGLFISGYCRLFRISPSSENLDKIKMLSAKLIELTNKNWSGACWGYNFDWQARAFFLTENSPTVVATGFIGNALLDAYELTNNDDLLKTARSACEFILKDLKRSYDQNGNFAFSYSPFDNSVVFNASLWGSQLLSRVYSYTKEAELIAEAKKSVEFCCSNQKKDGSWTYGIYSFHQWTDSFHTGYNLECINDYMKYSGDESYIENVRIGFDYYIKNFFTEDGIPKYYDNSTYPIDIHSPAQLVITLAKMNNFSQHKVLVNCVLDWTVDHMFSPKGYFYYQINKYFSSKVPYMRWAQAWMFYSICEYKLQTKERASC